jgi:hypothetical protein
MWMGLFGFQRTAVRDILATASAAARKIPIVVRNASARSLDRRQRAPHLANLQLQRRDTLTREISSAANIVVATKARSPIQPALRRRRYCSRHTTFGA